MNHILFKDNPDNKYAIALLIKKAAFQKHELKRNYVDRLTAQGIDEKDVIGFDLSYDNAKVSVKHVKSYLESLLPALDSLGTKYLYVADATYFKKLAGVSKAEPSFGYVLPCKMKGFEHMHVVLGVNYQQLIFDPRVEDKMHLGLDSLAAHSKGTYQAIGSNIIHSAVYPKTLDETKEFLKSLHQYDELYCDTEAFDLKFWKAKIGTIGFAWDKHNGGAFSLHDEEIQGYLTPFYRLSGYYPALKEFFTSYQGNMVWHNAPYDLKNIIFELWMERDPRNIPGMIAGLMTMTRHFDDTKIIAYLATNSTAGNSLSLKSLAHEFAGNWAVDVTDITQVPINKLLQYNLVDCLSTAFVKEKYYPIMVADNQKELYETLFRPSLKTIIQMELVGMPMHSGTLDKVSKDLQDLADTTRKKIEDSPLIAALNLLIQNDAMDAANAKLKVKQHPLEHFADVKFNPNSGPQLQKLLYTQMGLPVIDKTKTGEPATGADTIEKLINHCEEQSYRELLQDLMEHSKVEKILSTFIPAFYSGIDHKDGTRTLHGSFNLGGTVSGRLSSSDPNLQNLPANSTYGKLIKSIFAAPVGWIFCGADFNALEARINALLTKDPNKLAVYKADLDSHSWNALGYWPEEMNEIKAAVDKADVGGKFYKLTYADGTIDYIHESDPRFP